VRDFLSFLIAVAVHECGHLAVARVFGVPLRRFSVSCGGLLLSFDFSRVSYGKEALVHLGGPLFGVVLSVVFASDTAFSRLSLGLSLWNLLPLSSLDGGGIVRALSSVFLSPSVVSRLTKALAGVTLVSLWLAVLWVELRVTPRLTLLFCVFALTVGEIKKEAC